MRAADAIRWSGAALCVLLMPGCPVRQEAAKPPESPELVTKPATPEPATRPVANASGYIKCVGRLVEYANNCWWSESWTTESGLTQHATGISQKATFRISSPSVYGGRTVGVFHQHEADLFTTSPPISKVEGSPVGYSIETPEDSSTVPTSRPMSPKGLDYSFEIPEDYFTGNFGTIRHHYIRNFRAVP